MKENGKIIFCNAFVVNQKYGKEIINGYDGLFKFFKDNYSNKVIYSYKSDVIDYKYFGLVIIQK